MSEPTKSNDVGLSDNAFIDWDGWLWDRPVKDGPVRLVSKDAETWLAGYRAALATLLKAKP